MRRSNSNAGRPSHDEAMRNAARGEPARLRRECRCFARYLVGVSVSDTVVNRYQDGVKALGLSESAALAMARSHPSLLGPLDAVCSLLKRDDALRQRLILLSAILETDVATARAYMPGDHGAFRIGLGVMLSGMRGAFNLFIGMCLLPFIR